MAAAMGQRGQRVHKGTETGQYLTQIPKLRKQGSFASKTGEL